MNSLGAPNRKRPWLQPLLSVRVVSGCGSSKIYDSLASDLFFAILRQQERQSTGIDFPSNTKT